MTRDHRSSFYLGCRNQSTSPTNKGFLRRARASSLSARPANLPKIPFACVASRHAAHAKMRALIEDYDVAPMPDASARGVDVTASWITPEHLSAAHLDALVRALSNVLATDVAEFTYAEIIDGLPTAESFTEFRSFYPAEGEHPACHHHRLCEGALEAAREARARFDPLTLRFDPQVSASLREG